ncbi:MAG TPA: iron-sulfur cluster assembly accessory protein [Cytophagales bacterium]|jgi:iron-sulfur cluster assembly protein|nr:iron-sulfur cluster assembly accessory protein [Cytophagales bacterium]
MLKEFPIKISEKALSEIKHIFEKKNIPPEYGLRIGMKGAGCAGTSFIIGFDKKNDDDETYEKENIQVYISKKHLMYVFGAEVDFVENEIERGFVFNN